MTFLTRCCLDEQRWILNDVFSIENFKRRLAERTQMEFHKENSAKGANIQFLYTRQLPPIDSNRVQSCLARSRVDSATRTRYQGAVPCPVIRLLITMGARSPRTDWNRF